MNAPTRDVPAPESYPTFWEPIPVDVPAAPPACDPKDAYQDFVNSAEDTPVSLSLQVSQIDI